MTEQNQEQNQKDKIKITLFKSFSQECKPCEMAEKVLNEFKDGSNAELDFSVDDVGKREGNDPLIPVIVVESECGKTEHIGFPSDDVEGKELIKDLLSKVVCKKEVVVDEEVS